MFKDELYHKSLCEICRPKQWPTIQTKDFTEDGYLVYGANGVIGHYSDYNHEFPTILMACRGASCGTINVSEPRSYITGNAMCLDDLSDEICFEYLVHFLSYYDYKTIITGGAQPQITFTSLQKVSVPIPAKEKQDLFVAVARQADKSGFDGRKSQFIEMFGDPMVNDKQWSEYSCISEITQIVLGSTPNSKEPSYWDGDIRWITPAEMTDQSYYIFDTVRHITDEGRKAANLTMLPEGTVLFSTRAPIGKVAIVGKEMCCNQGFKNFICSEKLNNVFLYYTLKLKKDYLCSLGTGTTFKELSKRTVESLKIAVPPIELQNQFETIYNQADKSGFIGLFSDSYKLHLLIVWR